MLRPGEKAPPLAAQPVFGLPVDLQSARRPVAVIFVHQLGSPFSREALAAIQEAVPRFDRAGVDVVVVTDSELVVARDFVPRHHLLFPVVCDPERELYRAWGVGGDGALAGSLRFVAQAGIRQALRGLRHGPGALERKSLLLPAAFLACPGGTLGFVHYARAVMEPPPLDDLIAAGGTCS